MAGFWCVDRPEMSSQGQAARFADRHAKWRVKCGLAQMLQRRCDHGCHNTRAGNGLRKPRALVLSWRWKRFLLRFERVGEWARMADPAIIKEDQKSSHDSGARGCQWVDSLKL